MKDLLYSLEILLSFFLYTVYSEFSLKPYIASCAFPQYIINLVFFIIYRFFFNHQVSFLYRIN